MRIACLALSFVLSSILVTSTVAAETVRTAPFSGVGLRGSGEVRVIHGPRQAVVIREGNASISEISVRRGGSLEIRTCRTFCPSHYRLSVEIHTPTLTDLAVSGSGRMSVGPGFAPSPSRSLAISGSGMIDAARLASGDLNAAVSGSGRIRAGSVRRLQAAVNGSGHIDYLGKPEVQTAISGSGWVGPER